MTPPWKAEGIPTVRARFSLSVDNEQADAGRDGRAYLAIPNYQARARARKYSFSLLS